MEDTIKAEIHSIFPTPIYLTSFNREFTKSELSFVDDTKSKTKEKIFVINFQEKL